MRWNSGSGWTGPTLGIAVLVLLATLLLFGQTPAAQSPVNPAAVTPPSQPAPPRYVILIDAAHGGSDSGAALNPAIPEKDVNLAFARRLRQELNARGILSGLVRDADTSLTLDQRAGSVNSAQPGLYLSLHAASQGSGVALYTAILPGTSEDHGPFLDWQTAQSSAIVRSRWAQQQMTASIQKMGFPLRSLAAALRPLNNITVPALAVEIAPTTADVLQLTSTDYQSMVCAALANAIAPLAPVLRQRTGP